MYLFQRQAPHVKQTLRVPSEAQLSFWHTRSGVSSNAWGLKPQADTARSVCVAAPCKILSGTRSFTEDPWTAERG